MSAIYFRMIFIIFLQFNISLSSFSSFSNKSRFELQYFCDFVHQPYKLKKNRFFVGLFVGNTTLPFCGKRLFRWNSLRHIVWFSLNRSPYFLVSNHVSIHSSINLTTIRTMSINSYSWCFLKLGNQFLKKKGELI